MLITASIGAAGVGVAGWIQRRRLKAVAASGPPDYATDPAWFRREAAGPKGADCFYAHPTSEVGLMVWNIAWDKYGDRDALPLGRVMGGDPDIIDSQAGAWASSCNIWAPRYRQMGMLSQAVSLATVGEDKVERVKECVEMAVGDLRAAFKAFLEQRPDKQRPFFIAAHSQGSILMSKVLKDCIDGTEHEQYLVAAYLCGGYLPKDLFGLVYQSLHACQGPTDTGCVISFDTRCHGFKPESLNKIGPGLGLWPSHLHWLLHDRYGEKPETITDDQPNCKPRLQINPGTWSAADGGEHLGVNTSFKAKSRGCNDLLKSPEGYGARTTVTNVTVSVEDPDPWLKGAGSAGGPNNMHPIDVHFWYHNIQANVPQRLEAWVAARAKARASRRLD